MIATTSEKFESKRESDLLGNRGNLRLHPEFPPFLISPLACANFHSYCSDNTSLGRAVAAEVLEPLGTVGCRGRRRVHELSRFGGG